jgi:uncharacterized protein (TIRG00374 family)
VTERSAEEPLEGEREKPLRVHLLRYVPAIVFLGLAVWFLIPRLGSIGESLEVVRTMRVWPLGVAALAEALSYLANGWLLCQTVGMSGDRMRLGRATAIVMGASTVSLVAAGVFGYTAAIFRWTRDAGVHRSTAAVAASIPPMFDGGALVVFALAGAIELLRHGGMAPTSARALVIVIAGLSAVVALSVYGLSSVERTARLLRRLQRIRFLRRFITDAMIQTTTERLDTFGRSLRSGGGLRAAAASLLNLSCDLTALGFVFIATGHPLRWHVLLSGYGVPLLLGRASFLPGGIAAIEIGMTAMYSSLGVPVQVAVVAVLTYRLISFWIPSVIGIPVAVTLQMRGRVPRRATDTSS